MAGLLKPLLPGQCFHDLFTLKSEYTFTLLRWKTGLQGVYF